MEADDVLNVSLSLERTETFASFCVILSVFPEALASTKTGSCNVRPARFSTPVKIK